MFVDGSFGLVILRLAKKPHMTLNKTEVNFVRG